MLLMMTPSHICTILQAEFCEMLKLKRRTSMLMPVLHDVPTLRPCFSVDSLVGYEATCFLKRMACRLSTRWDTSFAEVLGWIHARLAFAIWRASVLCIRGSRTKWRSLGLEDGAAIDLS